ncbi:MAG: hypothetical protein U5L00_16105 [Desulfovermiculus sp.]|nr:hypothetical protein [Desulfovermiculus sp.]
MLNQYQHPSTVPWTTQDTWLGVACLGLWLSLAYGLVLVLKLLAVDISPGLMMTGLELALLLPVWWLTRQKYGTSFRHLGLTGFKARYLGVGLALFVPAMWLNALYEAFLSRFGLKMQPGIGSDIDRYFISRTVHPGRSDHRPPGGRDLFSRVPLCRPQKTLYLA